MSQTVKLTQQQPLSRVFQNGNLYPQDLNEAQSIQSANFASFLTINAKPGIVSELNPTSNSDALSLQITGLTSFLITSGSACFQDGSLFVNPSNYEFIFETPEDATSSYLVCLRKSIEVSKTRYNAATENVEAVEKAAQFWLELISLSDFSYLPETEVANRIILGQVIITASPVVGFELIPTPTVDEFRRQWHTIKDQEHRGQLGTGTASGTNPHGMSLNDLDTLPGMSYWQLNNLTGAVTNVTATSRNRGDLTQISISIPELQNNVAGGPTTFRLPRGAAKILAVQTGSATQLNFVYDRATRVVTCYPTTIIVEELLVWAILVHAGTTIQKIGAASVLEIEAPIDGEFLVASNSVVQGFTDQEINLEALAGAANVYQLFCDDTAQVVFDPAPVAQFDLFKLQNTAVFNEIYLPCTNFVNLALTNFLVPSSFTLSLKISGRLDGTNQQETLTITDVTQAGSAPFQVPAGTNLGTTGAPYTDSGVHTQWLRTTKQYSTITSIQVVSATNIPSSLAFLLTQNLLTVNDMISLATVKLDNKGNILELLDTRDQKIFSEKLEDSVLQENFHNPINFNPEVSDFATMAGLYRATWRSIPLKLLAGTYLITLAFDAIDETTPVQVAATTDFGVTSTALTPLDLRASPMKRFYRWTVATGFYTLQVVASKNSNAKVQALWLNWHS